MCGTYDLPLVIFEDVLMLFERSMPEGMASVFIVSSAVESEAEPPGNNWVS